MKPPATAADRPMTMWNQPHAVALKVKT